MTLKLRKDINGLRAIAVLSVILFHTEIFLNEYSIFEGGFIGVDIFFVISGYLITLLLLKELKNKKKISILHFYERRARRILPLLLFIILISLFLGFFFLSVKEYVDFSYAAISSIFFSSNIYFYFAGLPYGAQPALLKPLLHTWSLSIEEQFYLIFPIILFVFFKYFKFNLIYIFLFSFLFSLMLSVYGYFYHSHITFFILPTRAWEILAGSIVAFLNFKNIELPFKKNIKIKNFIYICSLLTIIFIIFLYDLTDYNIFFPIFFSVISTSLIIYLEVKNKKLIYILSNKLFYHLGLISYSIYLWHFPIFSYSRLNNIIGMEKENFTTNEISVNEVEENLIITKLILIAITIALSIITYNYIEKIFRDFKKVSSKAFFYFLSLKLILIISICVLIISFDGFNINKRFKIDNYILDNAFIKNQINIQRQLNLDKRFSSDIKKNVLVIGNSHGIDFFHMLKFNNSYYKNYEFQIYGTQVRCLLRNLKNEALEYPECLKPNKNQNNDINIANFNEADIIILSTRWHNMYDWHAIKHVYYHVKSLKKELILILNFPEFYVNTNRKNLIDEYVYRRRHKTISINTIKDDLDRMAYNSLFKNIFEVNREVMNYVNNLNIDYVDPLEFMCNFDEKKCDFTTDKGEKIYYDYGHFSLEGAKYFGKKMAELNLLKLN